MLPAIRPPSLSQPATGSEEGADVDDGAADEVTEDDELREMNRALETGQGSKEELTSRMVFYVGPLMAVGCWHRNR